MRTHFTRSRSLLLFCLLILIAVAVVGVRAARWHQRRELPQVISKVKDIEVVSTALHEPEGAAPFVEIVLRNNSARPVVAVDVESGDDNDASGIIISGFSEGPPTVIIEPYGSKTVEMLLSNLLPGKPIKVGGAMFADGGEEGDEIPLRSMRDAKERDKAAKKGGAPQ